jgi:hypothetical protein
MKKRSLLLVTLLAGVLLILAVPVQADRPGIAGGEWTYEIISDLDHPTQVGCNLVYEPTMDEGDFEGTFEGSETEVGVLVFHCNGAGSFKGFLTFTGTVDGTYSGTLEMRIVGTSSDLSWWEGTWVILGGTGDLATLRGQGTWEGPAGSLTYDGNYHFEPG